MHVQNTQEHTFKFAHSVRYIHCSNWSATIDQAHIKCYEGYRLVRLLFNYGSAYYDWQQVVSAMVLLKPQLSF